MITNELPFPRPGLVARRLPPWSSARLRASGSPSPRPLPPEPLDFQLRERLEDSGQLIGRQAVAGVLDRQPDVAGRAAQGHSDTAAAGRVLDRVVDEVREHLHETDGISVDPHGFLAEVERQRVAMPLNLLAPRRQGFDDDCPGVDRGELEVQLAVVEPGGIGEIGDQPRHELTLPRDDIRGGTIVVAGRAIPEERCGGGNRVEGIAQLVAHERQELALPVAGTARGLAAGPRGPSRRRQLRQHAHDAFVVGGDRAAIVVIGDPQHADHRTIVSQRDGLRSDDGRGRVRRRHQAIGAIPQPRRALHDPTCGAGAVKRGPAGSVGHRPRHRVPTGSVAIGHGDRRGTDAADAGHDLDQPLQQVPGISAQLVDHDGEGETLSFAVRRHRQLREAAAMTSAAGRPVAARREVIERHVGDRLARATDQPQADRVRAGGLGNIHRGSPIAGRSFHRITSPILCRR